jgi:hypothetical protein
MPRSQKADLLRDGRTGVRVIARDHDRPDPRRLAGLDGLCGLRPGRIDEADETQEDHLAFGIPDVGIWFLGHRKHP